MKPSAPPLSLLLGIMALSAGVIPHLLADEAVSAGIWALNAWSVLAVIGGFTVFISFLRWPQAGSWRMLLWGIFACSVLVTLWFGSYFLRLVLSTYHGHDWLTWYDEDQIVLPVMNFCIPAAATALCGLGILAWKKAERLSKVFAATAVLGIVMSMAIYQGSIGSSRDPDWSLSHQVWWLPHV